MPHETKNFTIKLGANASGDPFAQLKSSVKQILEEATVDTNDALIECINKAGERGAKTLRSKDFTITGENRKKYVKGWTYQKAEKFRFSIKSGQIYNKRQPALTHILEFGHPIMSGGKKVGDARAFPHIEPTQEEVVEYINRNLEKTIQKKLK